MKPKKDEHNRRRDVIVNFRMSPRERDELELRIEWSGRKKQDYMIQSALCQKVIILGNITLVEKLKKRLNEIEPQLHKIEAIVEKPIIITELRIIFEIADGWKM